jgi:hypothetical protein
MSASARVAFAARNERKACDAITDTEIGRRTAARSELDDAPGELVPHDQTRNGAWMLAASDVEVGPANPAAVDPQHSFTIARLDVISFDSRNVARSQILGSEHAS